MYFFNQQKQFFIFIVIPYQLAQLTIRAISKVCEGLQSKDTKSAKRHLKKLSDRMARFSKDVNHCISKTLVVKAKDTSESLLPMMIMIVVIFYS